MSDHIVVTRRQSWPIRGLFVAVVLILTGYAMAFGGESTSRVGALALAAGNALLAPTAMALGAPLRGRWGRPITVILAATGIALFAAISTALLLPNTGAGAELLLGFPRRTAIVLYGAGVAPLLVLPALFAATFDTGAFDPEHLARLRALTPTPAPDETAAEPAARDA